MYDKTKAIQPYKLTLTAHLKRNSVLMEIKYPEYRIYLEDRQYTNDSIMGLLVGSKLASHVLKITEGSERTLPEIFPGVDKVQRFNLKTSFAQDVLDNSEAHLGAMAVPHLLGSHEDYGKNCLKILRRANMVTSGEMSNAQASNIHVTFQDAAQSKLDVSSVCVYELLRKMRNCLVHQGGTSTSGLEGYASSLDHGTISLWEELSGEKPPLCTKGSRVYFSYTEMVIALAVLKNLSRQMNEILGQVVSKNVWVDIMLEDFDANTKKRSSNKTTLRAAIGFSKHYYNSLGFSEDEIKSALENKGLIEK